MNFIQSVAASCTGARHPRGRVTERIRAIIGKVPCKDRAKLRRLTAIDSNAVVEDSQSSKRRRRSWF
jgi:hypothetical protein